ncbi:MAG: recombinase family protein [Faecalimonas umbilicata]|uniref:recombinase family protein n=1 Tax=Faecalimonas umbilicata TaxID=1912855 RepID=UPI00300F1A80
MARKAKRYLENNQEKQRSVSRFMVGVYARISVDADERKSESIENQVFLIRDYIEKCNTEEDAQLIVYDVYTDCGKTGTNFDREGFERLMRDVKSGQVNCIIVKDFSRFGRNYIETGNFIEKILPFLGVRFIAISDGYDSFSADSGHQELTMNIENLVNDMYAKDISRKEKVSRQMLQKSGDYVSSIAPYGYEIMEMQGKHRLIIVPEAAEIVRRIFEMYASGMLMKQIRMDLFERKVHRASDYRKYGHVYQQEGELLHEWGDSSIRALLNRQNYYGDLVQHKYESRFSEGKKWCRVTREEEWIIIENTHEAIISKNLFLQAQERLKAERRNPSAELVEDSRAFSNVMYCGECGRKLVSHRNETNPTYYCPASRYIDERACHNSKIKEEQLQDIVRKALASQMQLQNLRKKDIATLTDQAIVERQQKWEEELQQMQHRQELLVRQTADMYVKYKEGNALKEDYLQMRNERLEWEEFFKKRKTELEKESKSTIRRMQQEKKYLRSLLDIKGKSRLNADLVEAVVDKILLYEDNRLEILFRFKGGEA